MATAPKIRVAATDLDGTLIPTDALSLEKLPELAHLLKRLEIRLIFVTGRHFASALSAIDEFNLPQPEAIICDVGTSVYTRSQGAFVPSDGFTKALSRITDERFPREICPALDGHSAEQPVWQLRSQESEKQSLFKQSYYCAAEHLDEVALAVQEEIRHQQLPFSVVHSVDPFTGDGLIDVLPFGVAKGYALNWWIDSRSLSREEVVYSGDSGNDTAAFCTGVNSTIVGNASSGLVATVLAAHPHPDRVFRSKLPSTAAVLDGLLHFAQ